MNRPESLWSQTIGTVSKDVIIEESDTCLCSTHQFQRQFSRYSRRSVVLRTRRRNTYRNGTSLMDGVVGLADDYIVYVNRRLLPFVYKNRLGCVSAAIGVGWKCAGTPSDIQYYIWNSDESGRYLASRLFSRCWSWGCWVQWCWLTSASMSVKGYYHGTGCTRTSDRIFSPAHQHAVSFR